MAKLVTQNDGARANHLTPADRAALGGYRAGSDALSHNLKEYEWLTRAYGLPSYTTWTASDGERQYEFGPLTDTPHPGTPPRVFTRLGELVELLSQSAQVEAVQTKLF